MTMLLDNPSYDTAELSVVRPTLVSQKEVSAMTATTATYEKNVRRPRPHGLDRAVMRMSLAMLLWARRHADRTALSPEQYASLCRERRRRERFQHDAALLVARVR